jgi:hypothetical protein
MAGPSTLPGPLGQIDRIRYGTRLNVFWYGETSSNSSKKSQNDLSIDLKGSGWYKTIVVNHPVKRTICGQDVMIVVLVDLTKDTKVASDGIWVDALSDATYGDDFCGGKMWHFAQEHKIDSLDAWKAKCKASDLNAEKIKPYLDVRNRAWEMYETFGKVFDGAGSEAPLLPPVAAPPVAALAPSALPPSYASPIPATLPPSAVLPERPPPKTPFVPSAASNTERYEIELQVAKILQDLYREGEAIGRSTTRLCTVCVYQGKTTSTIKNGVMVPACLLGDRKYLDKQDGIFRFKTQKDPKIYNGYSVCVDCATSGSGSGIAFVRIDETNQTCVVCLSKGRYVSTMLCTPCGNQVAIGSDETLVMDNLLAMLPSMYPHYKIRLPARSQVKFEVSEYKIDYHFDAQYYDGISGTWKKIKFLFELDQGSHVGYHLWTEKTRLVRVLRGTLESHAKVVMLRLNHTHTFAFPPGFSDDVNAVALEQANFHMRFLVLRHWVLYFLQNTADLPPATLLYLYYRYQSAYDAKYGEDKDQRVALFQEDDITQDSGPTPPGQERLPPLWKHACTGFAFSSPPVRDMPEQVNWRYYVTNSEYKNCNPDPRPGQGTAAIGPTLVGKMQAACERAQYAPFPFGLRSDMPKFPSLVSPDEAFSVNKNESKNKKTRRAT